MATKEHHQIATARALVTMLGVFPKIAAGILGVTAVAYVFGYFEMTSYYDLMGANWVVELLSTTQMMLGGGAILYGIGILCSSLLVGLFLNRSMGALFAVFAIATVLSGLALALLAHYFSGNRVGLAINLYIWAGVAGSAGVGSIIGFMIWLMASDGRISYYKFGLLISVFTIISVALPEIFAKAKFLSNSDTEKSTLSVAVLSSNDGKPWRLVSAVGDRLLLVTLAKNKEDRRFRLVDPNSIIEVHSPENIHAKTP